MKKLLTLTLALVALSTLSALGVAQERGDVRQIDPSLQGQPRIPSLPCCECLGKNTTLNLSTGQASPIDPLWKVNLLSAYTTPKVSSWIALPPANWIQPVASPTPSNNVAPGVYKYTVKFNIQAKCTIPSEIRLTGNFSADNSAQAFLDLPGQPVGSCAGPTCFAGGVPLNVNPLWLTPGNHTLEIDVTNNEGYSGLIVNAQLTRHCARRNPGSQTETTAEPN